MSTSVMEWMLCVLALSSLCTVNAAALKEEEFVYTSEIRIVDRSFQAEYGDPKSSAYKALTEEMKTKIVRLYENHLGGKEMKRIEDFKFSNGSLVVRYKLVLAKNVSATKLTELLAKASKSTPVGFRINSTSVRILEIPRGKMTINAYPFTRAKTTTPTTSVTRAMSVVIYDVTPGSRPTDRLFSSTTRSTDEPILLSGTEESHQQTRSKLGCTKIGCLNGGTCIRHGDLSWCKCLKFYSGLHCGIGHTLPRQYNDEKTIYRNLVIVIGCMLCLSVLVLGVLFVTRNTVLAQMYGHTLPRQYNEVRGLRTLTTKVHPIDDHANTVAKPDDSKITIKTTSTT